MKIEKFKFQIFKQKEIKVIRGLISLNIRHLNKYCNKGWLNRKIVTNTKVVKQLASPGRNYYYRDEVVSG